MAKTVETTAKPLYFRLAETLLEGPDPTYAIAHELGELAGMVESQARSIQEIRSAVGGLARVVAPDRGCAQW